MHLIGDSITAANRARTILDSLRLPNGEYHHEQIPSPDGGSIQINAYADRCLADRARQAETHSAAFVIFAAGIHDADVAPRDGTISRGWTPL